MRFTRRRESPLGTIILTADGTALTGLWFEGQRHAPDTSEAEADAALPVFDEAERWLDRYFSGQEPGDAPPLRPAGTPFQTAVWEILRTVPYGATVCYGEVARKLERRSGRRVSARAVGGAVGRNPISLMIPCHRVVGANGALTGYAGGLERKRRLLDLERQAPEPPSGR